MVKNPPSLQESRIHSLSGKSPCERKWQPTPVFLPRKYHAQSSLGGHSPQDHKRVRHDLETNDNNDKFINLLITMSANSDFKKPS